MGLLDCDRIHKRRVQTRRQTPGAHHVDLEQKRELTNGVFHQSHGSFELALAPVILALLGFALDHLFGITPVCTVTFAVAGTIGAFAKLYYGYRAAMDAQHARRPGAGLP